MNITTIHSNMEEISLSLLNDTVRAPYWNSPLSLWGETREEGLWEWGACSRDESQTHEARWIPWPTNKEVSLAMLTVSDTIQHSENNIVKIPVTPFPVYTSNKLSRIGVYNRMENLAATLNTHPTCSRRQVCWSQSHLHTNVLHISVSHFNPIMCQCPVICSPL